MTAPPHLPHPHWSPPAAARPGRGGLRAVLATQVVLAAVALTGCVGAVLDERSGPECQDDCEPVEPGSSTSDFTREGGCGEATFWTATEDEEKAILVQVDLDEDRDVDQPVDLVYQLPDPAVDVSVLEGEGLGEQCQDVVIDHEVDRRTDVVEGTVTIRIEPGVDENGHASGFVDTEDLVDAEGYYVPPVTIRTDTIGFHAG